MRLLLYFLAMLTGISAAEAARPVEAVSPTSAASQLHFAESVASNAATVNVCAGSLADGDDSRSIDDGQFKSSPPVVQASTPVSRAERAHT